MRSHVEPLLEFLLAHQRRNGSASIFVLDISALDLSRPAGQRRFGRVFALALQVEAALTTRF